MATMGIAPQTKKQILDALLYEAPRGRPVLILTHNVGRDYVFGVIADVKRPRGDEHICILHDHAGPHYQLSVDAARIPVSEIYRVIFNVASEFDADWRKAVGQMGRYWLFTTTARDGLCFGRISHTRVMPRVLADGSSAEVAFFQGWVSAPMFYGSEIQTSKITGVVEVFP